MVPLTDSPRLRRALEAFDAANSEDPVAEPDRLGRRVPRALLYSQRMSDRVQALNAAASEELRLAARCQHLRRWEHPRSSFPEGREGYLAWRRACALAHRDAAAAILEGCDYDDEVIRRVGSLLLKEGLADDPEAQCLEDAACLVFIEFQLCEFGRTLTDSKLDRILRRTWDKMSARSREVALALELDPQVVSWIRRAGLIPEGDEKC